MRRRALATIALSVVAFAFPVPIGATTLPGFQVDISDTTVQVGDTLTFTPIITDADPATPTRCQMWIEHYDPPENWVRMNVASDGCEPWTFVVPPGPLGQYVVVGRLYVGVSNGAPINTVLAQDQVVDLVAGGTSKPFVTNYPVQSWALGEIVSTSTPTYGVPLTIFPASPRTRQTRQSPRRSDPAAASRRW